MEKSLVAVGEIIAPRGIGGELKVRLFARDPKRLDSVTRIFVTSPDGVHCQEMTIEEIRYIKGNPVIRFAGCPDIGDVEHFRSWLLELPEEEMISLEEDEYFWHDFINARVVGVDATDYGVICEILETGANDVLIARDGEREYLIPLIKSVLRSVDKVNRIVTIEPLPGLFSDDED